MAHDLTPDQASLRACVEELDALEKAVNERQASRAGETKDIPFEFSYSFIFNPPDGVTQQGPVLSKTFRNGAEDLYFTEPNFTVQQLRHTNTTYSFSAGGWSIANSSTAFFFSISLQPTEGGIGAYGDAVTPLDLMWNYSIGSQGEKYGSPVNDLQWLSRPSLGNRDRWLPLAFRYPLRLKGGDSITYSLKLIGSVSYLSPVIVNMTMTGRRTGLMAESAFDGDFYPAYRKDK